MDVIVGALLVAGISYIARAIYNSWTFERVLRAAEDLEDLENEL